ncbi:MAG: MBL fold metallo-hydrolase [Burkholderiales bacterium]|nr:MBL fold metallo-hydrolase [Burkholderiales bacterium]
MKSFGARAKGERLARMRASEQWVDGEAAEGPDGRTARPAGFRNRGPIRAGLRDASAPRPTLGEFLCGGDRRVPSGELPLIDPREAWRHGPGRDLRAELRVTWLGHSTVLLEMGGRRFLTDPVWGARASPSRLAGPKRFHPVPVALKALPPLDAVLVSHDHYDHLCIASVRELARLQPGVPFVTSLGVGAHLEAFGVDPARIIELDWWESHLFTGKGAGGAGAETRFTAVPAQHFSGRGLKDRNATLWSSFVIESERERVFFSGDTGLTDQYAEIRARFGGGAAGAGAGAGRGRPPFDLVMLEVGAFHPSWCDIHLGPRNALEALSLLGGGALLPVHWSTFSLALHAWDEPAETLLELAPAQGVHLVMPRLGEPVHPARVDAVRPWWRGVDSRAATGTELLSWPKALPFPLD